ncbi:MAG: helix-turn-helix transcriptional regulator [Holosporaceae bacterium]|nr:helix-turn-helix transcriptional regulator [Holosporaceae bacterium]
MKDLAFRDASTEVVAERVGRKRKDAPMTHLKYLRKRSGYTLETLSEITSISISYLSRLESGSRRLNTDLIRRLSHAFSCEPAELLQEVSHDSHVVTPIEFNRKRRDLAIKESSMPLYCVTRDENNSSDLVIKICSPAEWRQRPIELSLRNDVFAIKSASYFKPHFSSSPTLYLEPSNNLAPESTVVILNCGKIMIKKIWSVTPTSLQLCDVGDLEAMKEGSISIKDKLVEVERNSLDVIYKVVGYSDFDIG